MALKICIKPFLIVSLHLINLCSKTLNVRSEPLNVRSEPLNVRSKPLNGDFYVI